MATREEYETIRQLRDNIANADELELDIYFMEEMNRNAIEYYVQVETVKVLDYVLSVLDKGVE